MIEKLANTLIGNHMAIYVYEINTLHTVNLHLSMSITSQ